MRACSSFDRLRERPGAACGDDRVHERHRERAAGRARQASGGRSSLPPSPRRPRPAGSPTSSRIVRCPERGEHPQLLEGDQRPGVPFRLPEAPIRAARDTAFRTALDSTGFLRMGIRAASASEFAAARDDHLRDRGHREPLSCAAFDDEGREDEQRAPVRLRPELDEDDRYPRRSASRTSASSASPGSPARTLITTSAPAAVAASLTTTAPGAASTPSSRTSCSASVPLTTSDPAGACASLSWIVVRALRTSSASPTRPAAFTAAAFPRARRGHGCSGGSRSSGGWPPSSSRRP